MKKIIQEEKSKITCDATGKTIITNKDTFPLDLHLVLKSDIDDAYTTDEYYRNDSPTQIINNIMEYDYFEFHFCEEVQEEIFQFLWKKYPKFRKYMDDDTWYGTEKSVLKQALPYAKKVAAKYRKKSRTK